MKQNIIQRLAQKYIRKQDKIPSNWKQIKIWIKEFSEYADMVLVVKEDLEKRRTTFLAEEIEKLKEEIKKENYEKSRN